MEQPGNKAALWYTGCGHPKHQCKPLQCNTCPCALHLSFEHVVDRDSSVFPTMQTVQNTNWSHMSGMQILIGYGDSTMAYHAEPPPNSTGTSYGHQFMSLMLHFRSSSLLMCLGKKQRIAQVLGPLYTSGKPKRSFWFLASDHLALPFEAIWEIKKTDEILSLSLSLSPSLSFFCFFLLYNCHSSQNK